MRTFQHLFHFAKKYTKELAATVISMILLVGVRLIGPYIIRTLINLVTTTPFPDDIIQKITKLTLFALLIYLLRAVLSFLRSYMAHLAGWGVVADTRIMLYQHAQRLSLRFYEDKQTGQLMSRIVNDTEKFEALIAHAVPDVIVNLLTLIAVTTVLMLMNVKLALLSLIPVPIIFIFMGLYSKYVRPAFRRRQEVLGEVNAILNDNLSGIREIKAFTRESIEDDRVSRGVLNYKSSLLYALKYMAIFHPSVELVSSIGTLIVIYFGGILVFNQTLPVADLVAYFLYLEMLYQPVRILSQSWEQLQESLASADRVESLFKETSEIKNISDPILLPQKAKGHLQINNVNFAYIDGIPVLENINLDIPAHSILALVGPTGVGKSTLASLIPRFYDVSSGQISLDGTDIRHIELENLRRQISLVLQDTVLFHGTVRDNLFFGKPNATEDELIQASKAAYAYDFIQDLPNGFDTLIGERGVKLSGGQKQRISIARAILKDAPILILDEATSAVDTETEQLIQQALEKLMQGKTTIIIAHRLSTVRKADTIAVLEGTGIVELGNHDQLIQQKGIYHKLYTIQESLN